jgi:hypothetical protein
VLIVTPVIFHWLRERDLRGAEAEKGGRDALNHRPAMGSAD